MVKTLGHLDCSPSSVIDVGALGQVSSALFPLLTFLGLVHSN